MQLLEDWIGNGMLPDEQYPYYPAEHLEAQYEGAQPSLVAFADTCAEPTATYKAVEEARWLCELAGVPFVALSAGDLAHPPPASTGTQSIFVPVYTIKLESNEDGPAGKLGQLLRQCTGRYKVEPVEHYALTIAEGRPIEMYLGISLDEAHRMRRRDPGDRIQNKYPLVLGGCVQWTRQDCVNELHAIEATIAKSGCVMCPYRRKAYWVDMYLHDRESYDKAVEYDRWVRHQRPGYLCFVSDERRPLEIIVPEYVAQHAAQGTLFTLGLEGDNVFTGCEEGRCGD